MRATILVLEDDSVLRDLLCEVLEDEGHQVVATSTLPALLLQAPHDADLLITDLWLSAEEKGLQAIDSVRAVTRPGLPALICTGATQLLDGLRPEIERLGAQLLEKPFTIDDLVALVEHVLLPGSEVPTPLPGRPGLQARCA